jgi:hypothetical protein
MVGLAYDQAKKPKYDRFLKTEFMLTLAHKMFTNAHTCH